MNITVIIVTSILCATFLIIRFAEMHNKRTISKSRRLAKLVVKLRTENHALREDIRSVYDEWFKDLSDRQRKLDELLDKFYELQIEKEKGD